jgi:hypothetical protein
VADELFDTLKRFYREVWEPEFDKIGSSLDGMITKAEMREHMKGIHQRFDRLEKIMRGEGEPAFSNRGQSD